MQESVFETLTEEYELAKLQEVKELPSVKVLDPADIPEKKSFPPRSLITALGGVIFFCVGTAWVLGTSQWQKADSRDPAKMFAKEVFEDVRIQLHKFPRDISARNRGAEAEEQEQGRNNPPGASKDS